MSRRRAPYRDYGEVTNKPAKTEPNILLAPFRPSCEQKPQTLILIRPLYSSLGEPSKADARLQRYDAVPSGAGNVPKI
jgi:hypothetical protein